MTAKEIKKEEIMLKVIDILTEKGIDNTSMKDLAEHLGTSKSYFYFYFPSKDDLIFSIYKYIMNLALDYVEDLSRRKLSPSGKIIQWIKWHFNYVRRRPKFVSFMYQTMISKFSLLAKVKFSKEIHDMHVKYVSMLANIVSQGQKSGEFRNGDNPYILASLMIGSLYMGIKMAYVGIANINHVEDIVVDTCLRMLGYEKI